MLDTSRAHGLLRVVQSVPAGFVTTYGDLCPTAPRFAGAVMAACDDPDVPWWRVVRADGSLAKGARQRRLLEGEGTPFRGERVDMELACVVLDMPSQGSSSDRSEESRGYPRTVSLGR